MMAEIKVEPTVILDELLDTPGREWSSDHVKGQNEWWKNCIDQYIRDDVPDDQRVILVELIETKPKKNSTFRVTDFGGTTRDEIDKAFKRWGDIRAASRGTKKRTFGGHGNGGKFYMRSAFATSRLITYRDGHLSAFGFNEDKKYGFLDGYADVEMTLADALQFAQVDVGTLPQVAQARLEASQGFTVVLGEGPRISSAARPGTSFLRSSQSTPRRVALSPASPSMHAPVGMETGSSCTLLTRSHVPTLLRRSASISLKHCWTRTTTRSSCATKNHPKPTSRWRPVSTASAEPVSTAST